MKFVSTKGKDEVKGLEAVARRGLAFDGGLFVPEVWPRLDQTKLDNLRLAKYEEVATELFAAFGASSLDGLEALVEKTYRDFRHAARAPLVQIGQNEWVLELFHGPTFAFKDFAMCWLAVLVEKLLAESGEPMSILCATSGDTGAAAAAAFAAKANIDLFVLFPQGRISPIQQRQITTTGAGNVWPLAIEGTFDDCQNLVKQTFSDLEFRQNHNLTGVNSINFARIMPQTVYYLTAALALGAPNQKPNFYVPSGNVGHLYAGWMAREIGLPLGRLSIATNQNNILARCVNTGHYWGEQVVATTSPSMDIQVASNFERLLFEAFDRDSKALKSCFQALSEQGGFTLSGKPLDKLRSFVSASHASESEVAKTIKDVYQESGYVLDPHTAVGVSVARKDGDKVGQNVILGTAHPGKFREAVDEALGGSIALPPALAKFYDREESYTSLSADLSQLKSFIRASLGKEAKS